jgi:predicted transcriptional regulator
MTNPFDYVNSITSTKENMMHGTENDELAEKQYNSFIVNRALSQFKDTIFYANEMNLHNQLDNKLQYSFLINIVNKKRRYSKWAKKEQNGDIDVVREYFQMSNEKAKQALSVLNDEQLTIIKQKLEKGG